MGIIRQIPRSLEPLRASITVVHPPLTSIPPHHSRMQGRLRMFCTLVLPAGATSILRVGNVFHNATEGQCRWFDESVEHSVLYMHANQARLNFYIDVPQPGMTDEEMMNGILPPIEIERAPLGELYWGDAFYRVD